MFYWAVWCYERLLAGLFIGAPDTALTNETAYPRILFLELSERVRAG